MKDEELQKRLQEAPLPEPVGGLDNSRERSMGRVRHRFPADTPPHSRSFWRPLGATTLAGALALLVFLAWPQPSAEADTLPSAAQMQKLYDQHEIHDADHFRLDR